MVEPWRVAQLAVDRGPGHDGALGSGYLIAPGRVLTAAHVVAGAQDVRVRLDVGQDTEVEVHAETWWADPDGHNGTDLAVVTIPEGATAGRKGEPTHFGRIRDGAAVLMVQAFGFPRFKFRADPADDGQPRVFRDFEQAGGHAPVAANRRQGTLAVYLDDPSPGQPTEGVQSPWEGMSGGSVWAGGRIVAVVAEHYSTEGTGRLTARRIDRAYEQLSASDLGALVELLGLAPAESGLPDVVPVEPRQLVQSAYLEQVGDIAPDLLVGREGELAEWAEFCAGSDPYAWWLAGPWAGKSALASWFVTHPPAGVDIVSFFITSRLRGQADSEAFRDAMIEQLNALDPAGGGPLAVAGAPTGVWLNLLASAAAQTVERARRLVVVVDGLDEDDAGATPSRGRPSIASLLPRRPPPGVRFIITSRPDPGLPDDLPFDHPLRTCVPHILPVSQAAKGIELYAKHELKDLLEGDQLAIDVVGYIAGSGGGLTRTDLSALSGAPPYKLDPILRGIFGRSLETRASQDPRSSQADPAMRVYLFAHQTLRVTAEDQLGSEVARYRQKVHEWVGSYADNGWPDATPGYAIRGYPGLLAAIPDIPRLSALARDPRRHALLLRATGSDYATLTEIRTAQSLIADQDVLDLRTLVELAAYRHVISIPNQSVPLNLPIAWAHLARFDHAVALARAITNPGAQAQALAGVATGAAQAGDLDRAEALARTIADPGVQAWALTKVATAAAQAGDLDRAEALARTFTDAYYQALALAGVATAAAKALDLDRGRRLAADAETLARTIADSSGQAWALTKVATAAAQAGDLDRAEALARTLINAYYQALALAGVATAAAKARDLDRGRRLAADAETLARTIADSSGQALALAGLATAAAQAGDFDRAEALARTISSYYQAERLAEVATAIAHAGDMDRAEALARTLTSPSDQAQALAGVATAAAQAGDLDRGRRLAADAEALSRTITDPSSQAGVLADLATAAAQAGDLDRAEALARTLTDPDAQAWRLPEVATAIAQAGDLDRADALARAITEPDAQARVLTDLARAAAQAGDLDRAEALARTLTIPYYQALAGAAVATAIAQAGDLDRARLLAPDTEALARTIPVPVVLIQLATAIAQAGDPDRAEALARAITPASAQAWALAGVAPEAARAGDLDRGEALARAIADPPGAQAEALAGVAPAAARAGDLDRGRRLAADAEALARTLTDPARGWALTKVATAAAQAGDLDRAEALARIITQPNDQAQALVAVATAAAQAGDLDRAEALARAITSPSYQAQALVAVATAAAQAGDLDRAGRLLARAIIIDPLSIRWVKAVCRFFPSAMGGAWDILPSAYTARR